MLLNKEKIKISIIGLGYVGLPLAVEFSKKFTVTGFDLNENRIDELNNGYDRTNELSGRKLKSLKRIKFVAHENHLKDSNIYIVTVPTPVDNNNVPDLKPLILASKTIARYLGKNNLVIYESTVYPGCTDDICVPILEEHSGKKINVDFFCGYSPERINPGDKKRTLKTIKKITSGSNKETSYFVDWLYSQIITAGTFKASSIVVAEAAKVIENTQRDVNIALINELALIFDKLNIDTAEVLEAAGTKWNFIPFKPGLVGGHCIGVDPYYLTHKAAEVGYHPEMILSGRRINDNIGHFIAHKTISELAVKNISPLGARVCILGLTFKENCPDLRNTKVVTIIDHLKKYECEIIISDEWADKIEAKKAYGISLVEIENIRNQDAVIIAVDHDKYRKFTKSKFRQLLRSNGVLIDVKSIYKKDYFKSLDITHWRF